MISKLILLLLGVLGLVSGGWAAFIALSDTTSQLSTLAMMGTMGYLFHSAVIFTALTFPLRQRRTLTLLLLVWHVPEAILIATMGMGIPAEQQLAGILFQSGFAALALLSWYLAKEETPGNPPSTAQAA
jgi:hypothetical protein